MQIHQLRVTPIPILHTSPSPVLISSREKASSLSPRIYSGRISVFMARHSKWSAWVSRLFGYPTFSPHRSSCLRVFALTTDFGLERSNLCGVERS
ncbi:hypothetical protein AVEN_262841-1 [Araneus ventricosus]|uniref:Uncharacterized protein n=1 Tax=Araneus ventricosus TaxID=182803 RepID=A0A4Y2MYT9_ARAVE|nr:hypothetical protein AVEN_262841-1 [Araneus ventricosus]